MKLSTFQGYLIFILITLTTYGIAYYFGWRGFEQEFSYTSPVIFQYRLIGLPSILFLIWWHANSSKK